MSSGGGAGARQLALGLATADAGRFESYFAGPNTEAVEVLRAIGPGAGPRVVYLRGARGTGKTHLLAAACAASAERGVPAVALSLVEQRDHPPEMLAGLGDLGVICIDDVDAVGGVTEWERALLALHEASEASGARLLVAAREAPGDSALGLPDLVSRLAAGLVLTLRPLDEPDRAAALRLRARSRGLDLGDDVVRYLFRRWPRDLGSMIDLLDRIDRASLAAHRRVTVPYLRDLIGEGLPGG